MPISTWSQDLARGLAHPESVAARQMRLAISRTAAQQREDDFECALKLLRQSVRTAGHVVQVPLAISSALKPMPGSFLDKTQKQVVGVVNEI
ncbi:hypothetical protein [Polaromonas sp.]|uniref:hypothetical protein n=1 Tax=Polaromonas sp. TaxID=1869339 RepID=UPI00185C1A4E|nr:hypothetical protein [Polaromonas sp.]NML84084.1 hypothetical protein [Polaromonas sp.]